MARMIAAVVVVVGRRLGSRREGRRSGRVHVGNVARVGKKVALRRGVYVWGRVAVEICWTTWT